METSKKWYQSKTIWVAIFQSIIGLLSGIILLLQQGITPEAITMMGVGLKGLMDIQLRLITEYPVKIVK